MKPYKHLTGEEKRLIDEYCSQHMKVSEIAKKLGKSTHTIYRHMHEEQIDRDRPRALSETYDRLLNEFRRKWRKEDGKSPQLIESNRLG